MGEGEAGEVSRVKSSSKAKLSGLRQVAVERKAPGMSDTGCLESHTELGQHGEMTESPVP